MTKLQQFDVLSELFVFVGKFVSVLMARTELFTFKFIINCNKFNINRIRCFFKTEESLIINDLFIKQEVDIRLYVRYLIPVWWQLDLPEAEPAPPKCCFGIALKSWIRKYFTRCEYEKILYNALNCNDFSVYCLDRAKFYRVQVETFFRMNLAAIYHVHCEVDT